MDVKNLLENTTLEGGLLVWADLLQAYYASEPIVEGDGLPSLREVTEALTPVLSAEIYLEDTYNLNSLFLAGAEDFATGEGSFYPHPLTGAETMEYYARVDSGEIVSESLETDDKNIIAYVTGMEWWHTNMPGIELANDSWA